MEPPQGLLRVAKCQSDLPCGQKYFLHLAGHQWVLQNPETLGNVSASNFLWLLPLALQGDEND